MKLNKRYGTCVICGKETILTYEHIPPKMALNNAPIKSYNGFNVMVDDNILPWDFEGRKYKNLQKGMGKYTLCKECNNNTGSWYGNDYCEFAQNIATAIQSFNIPKDKNVIFECKNIYPLRIVKQIVSMFLSVNYDYIFQDLQEFVKDRYSTKFDESKYQIRMYLNNGKIHKLLPKTGIIKFGDTDNLINWDSSLFVSEITTFPLCFILYFDPTNNQKKYGTDITSFCKFGYDDECNIQIPLALKEVNTSIHCDFRTKDEVESTIKKSKEIIEQNKDFFESIKYL